MVLSNRVLVRGESSRYLIMQILIPPIVVREDFSDTSITAEMKMFLIWQPFQSLAKKGWRIHYSSAPAEVKPLDFATPLPIARSCPLQSKVNLSRAMLSRRANHSCLMARALPPSSFDKFLASREPRVSRFPLSSELCRESAAAVPACDYAEWGFPAG
jgi:hypothetical protein